MTYIKLEMRQKFDEDIKLIKMQLDKQLTELKEENCEYINDIRDLKSE